MTWVFNNPNEPTIVLDTIGNFGSRDFKPRILTTIEKLIKVNSNEEFFIGKFINNYYIVNIQTGSWFCSPLKEKILRVDFKPLIKGKVISYNNLELAPVIKL